MTALRPGGSTRLWRRIRLYVLERDGWRCRVPVDGDGRIDPAGRPCGLPAVTADHVIPRALWPAGVPGVDDPGNLRAACEPHNLSKGGRLDVDAAGRASSPPARRRGAPRPPRAWSW